MAGDYDRDGKLDPAVWRPTEGRWYVVHSRDGSRRSLDHGVYGDTPVPGDYAVWRPWNGRWYVRLGLPPFTFTLIRQWGQPGDLPVPADYDGDGATDLAVWRPSLGEWHIRRTSDNQTRITKWGGRGDVPVPADYDVDGFADIAFWRPSEGRWYIRPTDTFPPSLRPVLGGPGDTPLTGDYDGDGRTDQGIWRDQPAEFQISSSGAGLRLRVPWGRFGDVPVTPCKAHRAC